MGCIINNNTLIELSCIEINYNFKSQQLDNFDNDLKNNVWNLDRNAEKL